MILASDKNVVLMFFYPLLYFSFRSNVSVLRLCFNLNNLHDLFYFIKCLSSLCKMIRIKWLSISVVVPKFAWHGFIDIPGCVGFTNLYFNYEYVIELNSCLSSFCFNFYKELSGIKIFLFEKPWFKPWWKFSLCILFCLFICQKKTNKHQEGARGNIINRI